MQPDEPDGPPERLGPAPMVDDSWDTAPTRTHDLIRRPGAARRLPWLALILAIIAVPVVVVSLLLSTDWPQVQPAAAPVASTSGATPPPTTPVPTTSAAPVSTTTTMDNPAGPPPFRGLVYEAEAGRPAVSLRRAEVVQLDGASGGAGVQFTSRSGSIRFESIDVPTQDSYRVTIVYVSRGDWSGEVHGARDSERVRFDAPRCCDSTSVVVRLSPEGDLTIEPSRGNGPLPTIDRIIIEPA